MQQIFDHECSTHVKSRKKPKLVDKQSIRDMRHKECQREEGKMNVAKCDHCGKCWTNNDLVLCYLQKKEKIQNLENIPDRSELLKAICFEATKPGILKKVPVSAIHANNDLHASKHVRGCFKKNNSKKKRKVEVAILMSVECVFLIFREVVLP